MEELILDKKIFNKNTNTEELEQGFKNTTNIEEFINQHGDNRYSLTIISRQLFTDLSEKNTVKNVPSQHRYSDPNIRISLKRHVIGPELIGRTK